MNYISNTFTNLLQQTAFFNLTAGNMLMILVAFIFLYLAIQKGFEPLLLNDLLWYAVSKYLSRYYEGGRNGWLRRRTAAIFL